LYKQGKSQQITV